MNELALARLLQLASQALPIGGYSHSQGMESAALRQAVVDEATALRWISDVLEFSMMTFEIPMLMAMHAAWADEFAAAVPALNEEFLAARESAELRAATAQMGYSMRVLVSVLPDFPDFTRDTLQSIEEICLPCVWSATAAAWGIEPQASALAYAWSWAENQVLAAVKTLPLGQSAGQRILLKLGTRLAQTLAAELPGARSQHDDAPSDGDARSNFTPALAILSSQHETQYSRLFRS